MLHRKKKSKICRFAVKLIIFLTILSVSLFILFECKARDLVYNTVDNELEILAQTAMDEAVIEVLGEYNESFENLIIADTAESSVVTSLKTDSKKINVLKSELSLAITNRIKETKRVTVSVPTGAFTGLVLLSSLGPELPVGLRMDGSCTTTIESEFTSAGINQTVHHIYLHVEADVSLSCPIIAHESTIISRYELCQTVIVGNTPNMFADLGN